jgi:flagellar motor switch protein FliM
MNFLNQSIDAVLADLEEQDIGHEKIESLLSDFAGRWRSGLVSISPALSSLQLLSCGVKPYSQYLQDASAQADIQVYQIEALQTICAISLDSRAVPLVVDLMFGGHGRLAGLSSNRRDTAIELRVRSRLLDLMATAFESACQPVFPIRLAELRQEKQLSMLRLASPHDQVLHANLGLVFNDLTLRFDFCISSRAITSFSGGQKSAQHGAGIAFEATSEPKPDSPWARDMQLRLNKAPVEAVAILAQKNMTIQELLSLSIGQVIPLSVPQEIPLQIDSVTFLKGRYGVKNGRYALQVGQVMACSTGTTESPPELSVKPATSPAQEMPLDQAEPTQEDANG